MGSTVEQLVYELNEFYFDPKKKYNVYAVVVNKQGKFISNGVNSYVKTHPTQAKIASQLGFDRKEYLHAEIAALVRSKSTKGHKIIVVRVDKKGNPKMAKPCPICFEAIRQAGIKEIEYSKGN